MRARLWAALSPLEHQRRQSHSYALQIELTMALDRARNICRAEANRLIIFANESYSARFHGQLLELAWATEDQE